MKLLAALSIILALCCQGSIQDLGQKGCATKELCYNGSVNFGVSRATTNIQCCSSNLCNNAIPPEYPAGGPNGKKCYTCNNKDCLATLSCSGNEDHCITANDDVGGQKVTLKGCATKTICDGKASKMSSLLGLERAVTFKCCKGELCNNAKRIGQSMFLLLAALLYIVLFN
ncbi:urokinase plasminogen activator surface receptor-like [Denticeps clupeoides]|uniref:urokinase plasminogen activator surface receptor-like n=1 Tax=Denticeps clupeoides TaxID=299321 RepID=UPI0010A498D9|nr:urokinase plasminogen activator surface receptor-like [Denticeps clupeoides]